ncbi:ABC transporter permease subunit [Fictibacillus barbaricus]|uniref:Peptide/nickel transport system permease protein n=1 Tax=Fictibacillus barbaricus TaxID=182136 RepID=A0ABU1TWL9_9BACL|nr:ABC transporter permease subunit [Fictibacillus barbaricus]MDR7071605.1 peptide/nickel transport system permease protein [Fictibacillus barbaricus]
MRKKDLYIIGFLSLVGVMLMGAIPFAFTGMRFSFAKYLEGISKILSNIFHPSTITYQNEMGVVRNLFPGIWDPYFYSLTLLFSSFMIAVVIAIVFSILVSVLPDFLYRIVRFISFVLESVPDILVAVGVQFFIIWYYKKTNHLLFPVATSYHEQPYFIPILCLTILPAVFCFRVLLHQMEEEWDEPYILTAKGKGLTRLHVLFYHILPHTLKSLFHQSKVIIWFMLSNLLVIELLFNIFGVSNFVYEYGTPEIFAIVCFMLFVPIYCLFTFGHWVTNRNIPKEQGAFHISIFVPYLRRVLFYLLKILRPLSSVFREPLFMIGFCFITSLLFLSFYHHVHFDGFIPQLQVIYDKDGITPLDQAPFEPSSRFWFGTDQFGYDSFYRILSGAKYTIGIAIFISLLRLLLSFSIGVILHLAHPVFKNTLRGISESIHYVPVALLTFFFLFPVLIAEKISFWDKGLFQIAIMTVIALPVVSVMIASEIDTIFEKEFITGAKLLGGNRFHIFRRHIIPHLLPKLSFVFVQQTMYVLILFAHLGLLKMFFGGTILEPYSMGDEEKIAISVSSEWSGMIGSFYNQILIRPHLILIPVLFFSASVIAINFMLEGIKTTNDIRSKFRSVSFTNIKGLSSLIILVLFIGGNFYNVKKFERELVKPIPVVEAAEKKPEPSETATAPLQQVDNYVTMNETLVNKFNEGMIDPLPLKVGDPINESNLGKPDKEQKRDDDTITRYYTYKGHELIITLDQDEKILVYQVNIHTNRETIMGTMAQQPDERSTDNTMLSFYKGNYTANFFRYGDDLWWVSIQKKVS